MIRETESKPGGTFYKHSGTREMTEMKRCFHVLSVVWLAGAILGCGGAAREIKPVSGDNQMTEEQKKNRDEQMQKSMERSGYGKTPAGQPGTIPPGK